MPVESQAHRQWEYLRDSLKLIPSSERGLRELRSLLVENGQKNQLTLSALQRPFTPYVQRMLANLPGPLFCAYVAPSLAQWGLAGWVAGAAVMAVQIATRNMAASILSGVAAMAALQALG